MAVPQLFFVVGCLFALIGVAAGAFGAHSLRGMLGSEMTNVFETGVRYQMYHALGLVAVGFAGRQASSRWHGVVALAGWCFSIGIMLFSGSLYLLALSGVRWLGVFTPLGGLAFLAGWAMLAWGGLRAKG